LVLLLILLLFLLHAPLLLLLVLLRLPLHALLLLGLLFLFLLFVLLLLLLFVLVALLLLLFLRPLLLRDARSRHGQGADAKRHHHPLQGLSFHWDSPFIDSVKRNWALGIIGDLRAFAVALGRLPGSNPDQRAAAGKHQTDPKR